jgi:succinate dehydrogenase/fumarate reductase flavoprotein subunit
MQGEWDLSTDVVIVGSGAAGLTAGITAHEQGCEMEVLEVADMIGGTSSISGGMPWVPRNEHMLDLGIKDSAEEALEYLRRLTGGREPDPRRMEAYVERAAEAIAYLESATPLEFMVCKPFGDYFANQPGGKRSGRSLDVKPFPARDELGALDEKIRRSAHIPSLTQGELKGDFKDPRGVSPAMVRKGQLSSALTELAADRDAAGIRANGGALVAALLKGLLDRGVKVRTNTRVVRLVTEDGSVVGVIAESNGKELAIGARRGVVLAAGGFEWNDELVQTFFGVPRLWPISPPQNRGDALIMGMEIGAGLANMTSAWGQPAVSDGKQVLEGVTLNFFASSLRLEPGVIGVNRQGRRFTNEAVSYGPFGQVHRRFDESRSTTGAGGWPWPNESPVWLIFDQAVRDKLAVLDMAPGQPTPAWVREAPTLDELAALIDVPPATLIRTVDRWNAGVERGEDDDFGRATAWFEGFATGGPGPHLLAKLQTPHFYAVALYDGAIGTAGGLRTDHRARVVNVRGKVIPHLYAVGNSAASAFGPIYPGAGATIGQALTFGYLAGLDLGETEANRAETALTRPGRRDSC